MEDKILIYSENLITLSESAETPDCLDIEFIICDFEPSLNDVKVDRDHIDEWINTLELKPIVGKIAQISFTNKNEDFTSHKAIKVKKKDENDVEYEETILLTDAFGTFYEVGIKTIDDKEVIYAKGKVWKRFKKAVEILQRKMDNDEKIASSWEVNILNSEFIIENGKKVKNILLGNFIGHCLLGYENGMKVRGAYDSSEVIEVAEVHEENNEFAQAFISDINEISQKENIETRNQFDKNSVDNKLIQENEGGLQMSEKNKNNKIDISSLTNRDISMAIRNAIWESDTYGWNYDIVFIYPLENRVIINTYGTLDEDFIEIIYSIDDEGNVILGEGKDVKMVFAPKTIIDTQLAQLTVAKEKAEKELSTLKSTIEGKDTEISELQNKINEKDTELSAKISSIVDLGKNISEKEIVIAEKDETIQAKELELSELKPYKEEMDKINAEKIALELSEKKESFKKEYLETKLISEKDLELSEVKEAIETMDNSKMEIFIAQKVIAKAKAGKPQIEVSELNKESKVEVNLSATSNNEEITAETFKGWFKR